MSNEVQNNETNDTQEADAINNLLELLNEDEQSEQTQEQTQEQSETELKQEPNEDIKREFESYKSEQEARINALLDEIKSLKEANAQDKEEVKGSEKEELLKELGLLGLDEKLAKLDKFNTEQKEKEEQLQFRQRFSEVENELKISYPNADFKALGELGGKLIGLENGDKEAWRNLAKIIYKNNIAKADETLNSSNANINISDTAAKLNKGESVDDIEIGRYLLSLSED